ncbi:MAG: type IV pilus assembly protein PilM [bacterium]
MGLFSDDSELIGIDIGATAIRLVQLKKKATSYSLVSFGEAPLPGNISQSDSKLDLEKIAKVIKDLCKSTGVGSKKVVTSLPSSVVFSTVIKMPPMNQGELAKAVQYQAEQNIPLKVDEVKIDWQVVRENPTSKELAVMVVAAPKNKVNRIMELFSLAEIDVMYLETSSIAVARSLSNSSDPLVMAIDFGGMSTELTIVENGVVTHVRSLPVAGFSLTRAISQGLGLDWDQAEQFKYKFGLSQDKLEGQIYRVMKPILYNLTDEISRSMKYYQDQYGGQVQKIILTGNSSRLQELVSFLKSVLGIEVVYGNAWRNVNYHADISDKLNQNSLEFACAVGLAMRGN